MPLILAIEPDRRQASKVVALAKSPLRAELIVAESTSTAFAALADRVPDLILTSLLLLPKDEHMLGDRLRELDAAGTKVQTLVIPVFATTPRQVSTPERGLLTRLRGSKGKEAVPEGCDPAVFAGQITEYLERAAAERQAAAVTLEDELPIQQDPVNATRQETEMTGTANVAAAREGAGREAAARSLVVALDPDLAEFVAGIETAAASEETAARRPLATPDVSAIVDSASERGQAPPAAPPEAEDPAGQPELMQLLTAIEQDIEQLRTDRPESGGEPAERRSSKTPQKKGRSRSAGPKTRQESTPPIQDDWDFFDREQCDFAALLTKLDEITDQDEAPVRINLDEAPAKKPARPGR